MSPMRRFSSGCCRGDHQEVSQPLLQNPYKNTEQRVAQMHRRKNKMKLRSDLLPPTKDLV
jgi:hypothetical protein